MQGEPVNINDFVELSIPVPGKGARLITAQVVAANGDQLSVVAQGERSVREVARADVQSYQSLYGVPVPSPGGDRPIVKNFR